MNTAILVNGCRYHATINGKHYPDGLICVTPTSVQANVYRPNMVGTILPQLLWWPKFLTCPVNPGKRA